MLKIDFTAQSLIVAWLISAVSLYYGSINDFHWFSRSGSVIVLAAVISEYQLLIAKNNYLYKFITKGRWQTEQRIQPHGSFKISKSHAIKEKIAHASVVFGTIIWGYGDLL